MCQLLESVYLNEGVFRNVSYHEARMQKALQELYRMEAPVQLSGYLNSLNFPKSGIFKTRIIYDTEIRKVEFAPYTVKPVHALKLVRSDAVSYNHKFLDRTELSHLYEQRGAADDVLIVKHGFITDASYANVILKKNNNWFTPKHSLLNGTMRQYLLDAGMIYEAIIDEQNYFQFESVKLINSMLGMDGMEIPIKSIH